MASFNMHLAVAKRYLEKNPASGINARDFYDGSVLPDLTDDKDKTHFGTRNEKTDLIKRVAEKINLHKFLESTPIDNDVNLGKYLHLITDWEYYNNFIPKIYLQNSTLTELVGDIRFTSNKHDDYLAQKYNLSPALTSLEHEIAQSIKNFGIGLPHGKEIFTNQQTDAFIERISSIDLNSYLT